MNVEDIRVAHAIPGRIRLKVPQLRENPTLASEIQTRLVSAPGIRLVEINPTTGSVLVFCETQESVSSDSLRALAAPLATLFPEVDIKGLEARFLQSANGTPSPLTGGISAFFGTLNTGIRQLTRGGADLKILVPLTLFVFGVRSLLMSEKPVVPTWYDFLWFALGTFFMLNPRPDERQ
jgi:hypothetical protein